MSHQHAILEDGTNLSECVFEALFKGVSTRFGLQAVEKCFENAFGKVLLTFQNLRLGTIKVRRKNPPFIFLFILPKSSVGGLRVQLGRDVAVTVASKKVALSGLG